jgi:hypothetical protein
VDVSVGVGVGVSILMLIIIDAAPAPPIGGKVIVTESLGDVPLSELTVTKFVSPQELVATTCAVPIQTAAPPTFKFPRDIDGADTQLKQDPKLSERFTP